MVAMGKEVK